ncbi:hypothetical protein M0802_008329 [Mischocyttarus mexicanus]|nr:hypothetical protein M0802_008329 [Mischocyttarus mexicanus]
MQIITRLSKLDLFALIFRGYGTQRCHNYYEILEVSPNCSQKEIRSAFITLSKKFHPDIIGQKGHDKFVVVQEAYNVLSKEHTRRQYDMSLKQYTYESYSTRTNPTRNPGPYRVYRSRREWEEHMARGNWSPNYSNTNSKGRVSWNQEILIYIMFGVVCLLFQLMIVNRGLTKANLLRSKYQREYSELRETLKGLSKEEQMYLMLEKIKLAEEMENKKRYNGK